MGHTSRWMTPIVGLGLALPLVLIACGDGTTPDEPTAAAPPTSAAPGPTASGPAGSGPASTASPATDDTADPSATGGTTGGSRITITRSGGFAGVMQHLRIEPDGSWVFTDKKTGQTQRGQLGAAQRQHLAQLVGSPALRAEARQAPPPGVCNDGFLYAVTVGDFSFRYEQCGGTGNRPTIDNVLRLVQGATPM
jgi:hypothetical protein